MMNSTLPYASESDVYFLKETSYSGSHPAFYNSEDFAWVTSIEENYGRIRDEIQDIINGTEKIAPNLNPPYLSSPDAWRNFYFMNFGWFDHKNCLKYPETFKILKGIPDIVFAGVTVLNPKSKVLPHIGETNATIRCHLGLYVPGSRMDCGITVKGESREHHNGKVVMFSDAHLHTTWNNTDEQRVLLVFDVVQKQFAHKADWVCANALAALTIKYIDEKFPLIRPMPQLLLGAFHKLLAIGWRVYLPIQKQFKMFYAV